MIIRNVIDENNVTYNAGRIFDTTGWGVSQDDPTLLVAACDEYNGEEDAILVIDAFQKEMIFSTTPKQLCIENSASGEYQYPIAKALADGKFSELTQQDILNKVLLFKQQNALIPPADTATTHWVLVNARTWPKVYKNIEKKVEPWSHFGLYIDSATGELKTDKDNVYVNSYDDSETGELKYEIWDVDSSKYWDVNMSNETCFIVISITPNILTFV